ncbi:MAG: metallophosphoesterase family protein [Acidobacteriaceae bacterium]|nr:metallophosphoesterase family protein [Acidobacteriaceae bacterium]
MRILILSDLHANWPALEAVLADAEGKYDRIVCCGDLVGYNPDPAPVVEWVRANCAVVIRGNHDKVVAGIDSLEWFNEVAQAAARWTTANLSQDELEYLRQLPPGPVKFHEFQMWHGSPRDEDEYITTARDAGPCFEWFELPVAFFGHTHLQGGFLSKYRRVGPIPTVEKKQRELVFQLEPDTLYLVNPGSVGQPRDGDPRAAYAVYEPEQKIIRLRRTKYPIEKTMNAIRKAGLPEILGQRLFAGI